MCENVTHENGYDTEVSILIRAWYYVLSPRDTSNSGKTFLSSEAFEKNVVIRLYILFLFHSNSTFILGTGSEYNVVEIYMWLKYRISFHVVNACLIFYYYKKILWELFFHVKRSRRYTDNRVVVFFFSKTIGLSYFLCFNNTKNISKMKRFHTKYGTPGRENCSYFSWFLSLKCQKNALR